MSTDLRRIRLIAVDTDGVLLNDTYSPAIERFVTKHGGQYTAAVERSVWGSPQLAAGQNMALACRLPWSAKDTIAALLHRTRGLPRRTPGRGGRWRRAADEDPARLRR